MARILPAMDTALFHFFNATIKNPFFDAIIPVFSDKNFVVLPGIVVLVLMLRFGRRHVRVCAVAMILAIAVSDYVI